MGVEKYQHNFKLTVHEEALKVPYSWKRPKLVFVNSMSDLFHKSIPLSFIQKVFGVMNDCPQHTFQVLTKRADMLAKYSEHLNWTPNIWMGVSVENNKVIERINFLRTSNAQIKFLSLEPLLGPLSNLNLNGIDWVIVGGESGPKARPMRKEWVLEIRDQCETANVPFFFKQWGGKNKKKSGRILDNKIYDQMPPIAWAN